MHSSAYTQNLKLNAVLSKEHRFDETINGSINTTTKDFSPLVEIETIRENSFTEDLFNRSNDIYQGTSLNCNATDPNAVLLSPNDTVGKNFKPEIYIKADFNTILGNQGKQEVSQTTVVFEEC